MAYGNRDRDTVDRRVEACRAHRSAAKSCMVDFEVAAILFSAVGGDYPYA